MKNIKLLLIVVLATIGFGVAAQNKTNLNYSIGIPMGDTKDFIGKTSFRGANIEFEHFFTDVIAGGIITGWNTFYEAKPRATYPISNGAITSQQFRYLNVLPIQITGKYYFAGDNATVRPFIGLNAGTYYAEQRNDNGLYSVSEKGWTWGLAPKAGVLFPISFSASLAVSLDYDVSFKSSKVPQQNWLGINVGFSWDY